MSLFYLILFVNLQATYGFSKVRQQWQHVDIRFTVDRYRSYLATEALKLYLSTHPFFLNTSCQSINLKPTQFHAQKTQLRCQLGPSRSLMFSRSVCILFQSAQNIVFSRYMEPVCLAPHFFCSPIRNLFQNAQNIVFSRVYGACVSRTSFFCSPIRNLFQNAQNIVFSRVYGACVSRTSFFCSPIRNLFRNAQNIVFSRVYPACLSRPCFLIPNSQHFTTLCKTLCFYIWRMLHMCPTPKYSNPARHTLLNPCAPKSQCFRARVSKSDVEDLISFVHWG